MQQYSGIITETPPMNPQKEDIIRLERGDAVYLAGQKVYGIITGFKKQHNGDWAVRLEFPRGNNALRFQEWCKRNPHKVKRFEMGKLIPKGGS